MRFSIIIPAYNCEDTLKNAVGSITCQEFPDAEIIIVDDGSRDSTPEIIEKLKSENNSIRSVRIENSGPANARNKGLEFAQGEFVMFIDSDDNFEPQTLTLVNDRLCDTVDMLIFGFSQNFFGKAEDRIYSPNSTDIDSLYRNNLLNQVWNKAYRRSFLNEHNIRFNDFRYGEDRIFNGDVLMNNPKIAVLDKVLYNYNIDNSVSLISGYIPQKFDACKRIYNVYSEICSDKSIPSYMFLKNVLSCMTVLFAENCKLSKEEKSAETKKIISDGTVQKVMNEPQNGVTSEIIRRIIKTGNAGLNLNFARTVAICQKKFLPIFLKFRG